MPDAPVSVSAVPPFVAASAPLLVAGVAVAGIGLATRRRELTLGGIRLAAVPLATNGIVAAVSRFETGHENLAPPPLVVQAMAAWLAQTLVGAALARFEAPPLASEG